MTNQLQIHTAEAIDELRAWLENAAPDNLLIMFDDLVLAARSSFHWPASDPSYLPEACAELRTWLVESADDGSQLAVLDGLLAQVHSGGGLRPIGKLSSSDLEFDNPPRAPSSAPRI